ncbi:carboxypeptidase regulatory-like domain-containing protein [Streptomyces sp. NPDC048196]|uniref:carboxypeptidase regulatory-like domain-containing protein n=1 Tax=Streptomyces sp. NPDC048196 TaxID=3154712 RepID=UPI0033D10EC6
MLLTVRGRLHGTLRGGSEGTPLVGGGIVVTDAAGEVVARTAAGADGRWEVTQLPPGSYTLVLSAPGHQPQARAVDVSGDAGRERQDVRLRPAATVRGTVRGPGGRPLADAAVTLLADADGTVTGHTVTGPDGAFAFAGLSGSRYTLTAAGYPPHATPISLPGGAEQTHDLTLTQPTPTGPQPSAPDLQPSAAGLQPAATGLQPSAPDPQLAATDLRPSAPDPELAATDLRPSGPSL